MYVCGRGKIAEFSGRRGNIWIQLTDREMNGVGEEEKSLQETQQKDKKGEAVIDHPEDRTSNHLFDVFLHH